MLQKYSRTNTYQIGYGYFSTWFVSTVLWMGLNVPRMCSNWCINCAWTVQLGTAVSLRLACRFSLIDPNHRSPSFLSFLPLCRSIDRFENHWFPCMQRWMLMFLSRSHFPPYLGYILQPCMVIGPQSRDTEITARASMMRLDHRLHSQENQVNVQANYPSLAINDVFLL